MNHLALRNDQSPREGLSDKYSFIPTLTFHNYLEDKGWKMVDYRQMGRYESQFAKHLTQYQNNSSEFEGHYPRIILMNSHNGLTSFKIMAGLLRLVCTNGLVAGQSLIPDITIRHTRVNLINVFELFEQVVSNTIKMVSTAKDWSQFKPTDEQKLRLATIGRDLRFTGKGHVAPELLLKPRRSIDKKEDLWTIFNVIQENLIKGGIALQQKSKNNWSIGIKAIDRGIKVNTGIFDAAQDIFLGKDEYQIA